ncbi:calcium-binding protein, partial [Antarcticimicrobium sediminis]
LDHSGTALSDGSYAVTAQARDAAGSLSGLSSEFALRVDGAVPGVPVVTGISDDTGTAGDGVTSDATLVIRGTGEAGAQVEVFLDAASIGTVTVDGAGDWNLDHSGTALSDGSYAVTAQARDAAGSLSGLSSEFALRVDGAAPGTLSIIGTPTEDQILTAVPTLSDDGGFGPISYQWMRNGTTITDATASTYTLVQADVGTAITLVAHYTNELGALETITSAATAAVTNLNDAPTGDLTITGTPVEDETLTAGNTLADEDGLGLVAYQWLRDGSAITGATAASYTLTQADVGAALSVTASYTDAQGTAESVISATTDAVIWADKILSGTSGDDYLRGRGGADQIFGLEGDDVLIGGFNDDILFGGTGDDTLHGWRGDDRLVGVQGNDQIFAGKGDDILRGGADNDALFGRKNDDRLFGGLGDDRLKGGKGDDTLTGGKGADVFIFARTSGADVITDFGKGEDVIEIVNGAGRLGQIEFAQVGDDVVLHFAETEITVLNTTIDVLRDADHFLFV